MDQTLEQNENHHNNRGVFLVPIDGIGKGHNHRVVLLCGLFVILMTLGLVNLYSASLGLPHFWAQIRNLTVVLIAFITVGWFIPVRRVNSLALVLYAFICVLLLLVDVLGRVAGGAQRWISLGFISFQPSEFAKLTTIILVANYFHRNRSTLPYRLKDLWPLGMLVGIIFVLIFTQPDFGTAGVCLIIAVCQLAFIRIDMRTIWLVLSAVPIVGAFGWSFLLMDYQKRRVLNLLNPELDPQNTGYHAMQSLIAIGSGNLFGKGYMQGTQTQLRFLPERHTDFIFAVFAEEHGFWGSTLVFLLFAALAYVALDVAKHARDTFSGLLAVGICSLIFIEFIINVAMVLGLFPVVGIPLPFFSYGSSSLLTICVGLGLLISIERSALSK
jgi:rod shape determining protein RodA